MVGAGDSTGNKSESLISKNSCSSWEKREHTNKEMCNRSDGTNGDGQCVCVCVCVCVYVCVCDCRRVFVCDVDVIAR